MRTGSGSSSEYSSDSRDCQSDARSSLNDSISSFSTEGGHRRRPSVPSEGGADRRRLAIVELDDSLPASLTRKRSQASRDHYDADVSATTATISSRRGVHVEGLALVAPPDASPRTYTDLTPPSTAPLSTERPPPSALRPPLAHQRSQSEVTTATPKSRHQHKSSRDIGIVGAVPSTAESHERPILPAVGTLQAALKVPIFQTPADSRSPTPGSNSRTPEPSEPSMLNPHGSYTPESSALITPEHEQEMLTPAIGESKEITQPVVGPIIVNTSEALRHRSQDRAAQSSISCPGDAFATRQSQMSPLSVASSSRSASPYVHYEPGVHSRAGPMPAPPQPLYDVDHRSGTLSPAPRRPPRAYTPLPPSVQHDSQALRDALQLPQSVSAVLASKLPSRSPKRKDSEVTEDSVYSQEGRDSGSGPSRSLSKRSMHIREGAHPPSTVTTSPPLPTDEAQETKSDESSNVRRVEGSKALPVTLTLHDDARSAESVSSSSQDRSLHLTRSRKDLRRESSWVSMAQEKVQRALSPGRVSRSPSTSPSMFSPTPPPKSIHGSLEDVPEASGSGGSNPLKGALTNLKRFSALPRTPSATSSRAKSPSPSPQTSPRHSESRNVPLPPPPVPLLRRVQRPRIKAEWPDAMSCRDVITKRNPLERSIGYAHKINELSMYDCGLNEWVRTRRYPATGTRTGSTSKVRLMVTPATPASRVIVPQPRHTSRGSEASEMTFPTRPDAYSATDLTTRAIDLLPPTSSPPPALPYPSLAQAQQARSPARSSTMMPSPSRSLLPLTGNKSSGGGFFSSIGRKSSVRKDKPIFPPNQPGRVLSKRNTATPTPAPRQQPVQVATSPVVPGGPRAAPGRVRRSQTFSVSTPSPPAQPNASTMPATITHPQRQSTARRPSLFARAKNHGQNSGQAGPALTQPVLPDPEFERQVDKLADLLPHADRHVLSGYLRRAGQDILAIGQYLEDEKNGTLRRD
ncbi:hypothetical protein DAEQUDRAFT_720734 [Daedalea quercina L-15889]|uniref:Uncharacterized protein n=1 Tax=Daedalea quercina L-15889 TaxID=1314783 RepID=A0A165U8I7_9APHY|nr:hypothetical protein DAEQUDRAFT_720734 [Daedalea quercina L-15889]